MHRRCGGIRAGDQRIARNHHLLRGHVGEDLRLHQRLLRLVCTGTEAVHHLVDESRPEHLVPRAVTTRPRERQRAARRRAERAEQLLLTFRPRDRIIERQAGGDQCHAILVAQDRRDGRRQRERVRLQPGDEDMVESAPRHGHGFTDHNPEVRPSVVKHIGVHHLVELRQEVGCAHERVRTAVRLECGSPRLGFFEQHGMRATFHPRDVGIVRDRPGEPARNAERRVNERVPHPAEPLGGGTATVERVCYRQPGVPCVQTPFHRARARQSVLCV